MKSRVPLTQENLQHFAGVPVREMNRWIDELLDAGVLDIDETADGGELQYSVPGRQRSLDGPATPDTYEAKRKLVEEAKRRILARRAGKPIPESEEPSPPPEDPEEDLQEEEEEDDDGSGVASAVAKAALFTGGKALVALDKPLALLDKPRGKGDKSLAASAALSLLGPVGWLYAGSFREAIPATLAAAAAYYVVPSFIMAPFLLVGALASSAVGLTYAWQYNRKKGRTPLFLSGKSKKKSKKNDD